MQLAEFQTEFVESLLNDETTLACFLHHGMAIYRNNSRTQLSDALKQIYPLILQLVSIDCFQGLARDYRQNYPSQSGNLNDYGHYFSDFLAQHPVTRALTYLPEVAQFEWLIHQGLFMVNPKSDFLNSLKTYRQEKFSQLRCVFHPAVNVLHYSFPLLKIIALCQGEINENINLNEKEEKLLLFRENFNMNIWPLSDDRFVFLNALAQQETLENATAKAHTLNGNFNLENELAILIDKNILWYGYL